LLRDYIQLLFSAYQGVEAVEFIKNPKKQKIIDKLSGPRGTKRYFLAQ